MLECDQRDLQSHFKKESPKALKEHKEQDFQVKFKTEICKNWVNGFCPFGEACAFAHGKEELRDKVGVRTKECKHFSELGCCTYGERCQFKHTIVSKHRLPIFLSISMRGQIESQI
ncbi:unnamed protein product [Blepharisma stoltei]|uniref:C3H1-type domain-containing protein n=1 Tax=Blepharisma stoltei TaxID=1481888 RepID=A0AAU9JNJ1_9CILI|nr:unnamed protein product [Blepharisma stoltei]